MTGGKCTGEPGESFYLMIRKAAFRSAFDQLERRIRLFASLRISELDRLALKKKVDEIGKSQVWIPWGFESPFGGM